jgi:hypothetical protein
MASLSGAGTLSAGAFWLLLDDLVAPGALRPRDRALKLAGIDKFGRTSCGALACAANGCIVAGRLTHSVDEE